MNKYKVNIPKSFRKISKRKIRDPRFDDLSGKLNEDCFRKSYSFLKDQKEEEVKQLKSVLKRKKNKIEGG
jgi:ribosomal RNA-processing protein 36